MTNQDHDKAMALQKIPEFSLNHYDIEDFIPHSPPMVLIDAISSYSLEGLSAEISIDESSRFYDSSIGGVPAWVGIEYMSQAIAALAGIHAKKENRAIKLGFLLGTRKYHIHQQMLRNGRNYGIIVSQLYKDDSGLASFDCRIVERNFVEDSEKEEVLCVQSKLNVFETNELQDITEKKHE